MEHNEKIIKNVVMGIVEEAEGVFNSEPKDSYKFSKIVPSLLKKGIDNLNLSMFSQEVKCSILTALGEEYRKKGNLSDAVKSFVLAGNKEKLNYIGQDYEKLVQFDNCIDVYKLAGNKEKLFELGKKCLDEGRLDPAVKAFIAIGDNSQLIEVIYKPLCS